MSCPRAKVVFPTAVSHILTCCSLWGIAGVGCPRCLLDWGVLRMPQAALDALSSSCEETSDKEGGETGCKRTPVSGVLLLASQGKIAHCCLNWKKFCIWDAEGK